MKSVGEQRGFFYQYSRIGVTSPVLCSWRMQQALVQQRKNQTLLVTVLLQVTFYSIAFLDVQNVRVSKVTSNQLDLM